MIHAIELLQRQIATSTENAVIVAAAGDFTQAELDRQVANDCQTALNVLLYSNKAQTVEDLKGLDDDLEDVPLGAPHCGIDGPCEGCQ